MSMKRKIIFDASVLVTAILSGNIFKTGIYRVSYEVLSGLKHYDEYTVYLYDVYERERELRKFVAPQFNQFKILPVESKLYRIFVYPIFNLADWFRGKELVSEEQSIKVIYKFLKNSVQTIGRCFRYIEKKRKIPSNYFNLTKSDIYFSTYNKIPIHVSFLSILKKVIIIHDLLPVLHPEYFFDNENKILFEKILKSISKDDIVICVSKSTKHDFLKFHSSSNLDNIYITHLAGAACFKPNLSKEDAERIIGKYRIPYEKRYFLSVCTIEPRKNIGVLIGAHEKLLKILPESVRPELILTGEVGWKVQPILDKINIINTEFPNSIILTGFVTDEELSVFYSNTAAFVYPSFYEGFGLPPLEAMQCGAPVITSNKSSLPEVVGNAGILIDPNNEEALVQALRVCLENAKAEDMRTKSLQHAALFSWDKTVNDIVNILKQI